MPTPEQIKVQKRAHRILEIAQRMVENDRDWRVRSSIEGINLHFDGYAEPGYNAPHGVIATGNWNDIDQTVPTKADPYHRMTVSDLPSRLCKLFERIGVEIEWSNEWSACSNCNKLFRTSPDSYSWQPSYVVGDGDITCHECLEEDPEEHLRSLEDNERTCNTLTNIDPADNGYVKVNDAPYETGFHPGQHDDPAKVAKELRSKGITRFLFNLDENGQFDARWSAYVHDDEAELLLTTEKAEDESECG